MQVRQNFNQALKSFNTIPTQRQAMKPETRKKLQSQLKDEIIALGVLLERDLSHWLDS